LGIECKSWAQSYQKKFCKSLNIANPTILSKKSENYLGGVLALLADSASENVLQNKSI
jgi:hypothetical protein